MDLKERSIAGSGVLPVERLGRAIRERRKALRLTQEELSQYAGCGLAFLYQLEHGKPSVRLEKVLDVLDILGLELRLAEGKGRIRIDPAFTPRPTQRRKPKRVP